MTNSTINVKCVKCNQEVLIDFKLLGHLEYFQCDKCDTFFNLFSIYSSLYNTIPLCTKIVDILSNHTYSDYKIDTSNNEEKEKIMNTLEKNNFKNILKEIIFDNVLFGNSFIYIYPDSPYLKIKRLNPLDLKITVKYVQEPPFQAYFLKIIKICDLNNNSINYDLSRILHFTDSIAMELFGDSILGFWFHQWYVLKDVPRIILELQERDLDDSELKWVQAIFESEVLLVPSIPYEYIFPWKTDVTFGWLDPGPIRFQRAIRSRRKRLGENMNRLLFPHILGRKFKYGFPKFIFT